MNKQAINAIRKQGQGGFTLIELIVVIVILGILAATALPRFLDLGGEARVAALNGARGAINSAASLVHARALLTPGATANMEGVTVNLVNGYPAADNTMLQAAGIDINGADFTIVNSGAASGTSPAVAAGAIAIVPNSVANSAKAVSCFVSYTQATATAPPAVAIVTNTCP
ncbi:type II secretion system protein [Pseudoduganella violacea]|uniref:MSHA pilin protein MshA n=1 Tax=Pseudoduganella violacea TaxID=1715466 RepID=A0A7W5FVX2_9BURK|nr:type II secretion system protein [Pseudoduganella violacea]MBB3121236.1 MSHA pilin protein MshA [Pseudoduganella violacea]